MTSHDPLQYIGRLPTLAADPARARRVRARCLAQLGRSRRRSERRALVADAAKRIIAPVVVGGLFALYFAALVGTALRLQGGV